jgi:hypothetical protein
MRFWLAAILLGSVACLAQAPEAAPNHGVRIAHDGGVREVLESIVVPPIPNAPFTATLDTEWVRYAGEGGTITLVNERHIARDGQGRLYEERWLLVPKNSDRKSKMNWTQIADPKQRTLYNCSTERKVCELRLYDPAEDLTAAAPLRPIPSGAATRGPMNVEDLGTQNIAGVETIGRRETTTIEAGSMGNDQPMTSVREYWHSQELGLNLLSIRSGPMTGKQSFRITELTPGEPDPQLFQLPAGYKITDVRKSAPISW